MMISLFVLALLVASGRGSPGEEETTPPFDCVRDGQNCFGGACNDVTGECTCDPGFGGFDCSYNESFVGNNCSIQCENHGVCIQQHDDEGNLEDFCACIADFYGDRCELPRARHKCLHDGMEVHVNPLSNNRKGGFQGTVYLAGRQEDEDNCYLKPMNDENEHMKVIRYKSCGGIYSETDDLGNDRLTFTVVVQYSPYFQTGHEELFNFTCNIKTSGSNVSWSDELITHEGQKLPARKHSRVFAMALTQRDAFSQFGFHGRLSRILPMRKKPVEKEATLRPIELALLDRTGQIAKGPQYLGAPMNLRYTLKAGDVYDSFRVVNVKATNGRTDDKRKELYLVRDGCVTKEGKSVVSDFGGDPSKEIKLGFRVFKFMYSGQLSFENTIKLCKEDGKCNATECNRFDGIGRRKREVDNDNSMVDSDNEHFKLVNATMVVLSPQPKRKETSNENGAEPSLYRPRNIYEERNIEDLENERLHDCLSSPGFIALVGAMLLLVFILFVAAALSCVYLWQQHHKASKKELNLH